MGSLKDSLLGFFGEQWCENRLVLKNVKPDTFAGRRVEIFDLIEPDQTEPRRSLSLGQLLLSEYVMSEHLPKLTDSQKNWLREVGDEILPREEVTIWEAGVRRFGRERQFFLTVTHPTEGTSLLDPLSPSLETTEYTMEGFERVTVFEYLPE